MINKSSSSSSSLILHREREKTNKDEQVLITEYLTGTYDITEETKIEEYNIIAVSPNDQRWYR